MASMVSAALRRGLALHRAALVPARAAAAAAVAPRPPAAVTVSVATAQRWQSSSGGTPAVSSGNDSPTGDGEEPPPPADAAPGASGDDAASAGAVPAAAGAVADAEAGGRDAAGAASADAPAIPTSATIEDDVATDAADTRDAETTAEPVDEAVWAPARARGSSERGGHGRLSSLQLIPGRRSKRGKSATGRPMRERPLPAGVRNPSERRYLLLRGASAVASRADVALFLASAGVPAAAVPRGEEGGWAPAASASAPSADAPAVMPDADANAGSASSGADSNAVNATAIDTSADVPAVDADADADAATHAADASSVAVGLAAVLSPPSDAAVAAASRIARLSFSVLHNRSNWVVELPSEAAATDAVARTQGRLLGLMLVRSSAANANMVATEGGLSFLTQPAYPGDAPSGDAGREGGFAAAIAAGVSETESAADARGGESSWGDGGRGDDRRRRGGRPFRASIPKFEDRARAVVVRSRMPLGSLDIFSLFSGYEVARLVDDPAVSHAVLVLMRTAEEAERVAMDKCHGGASVEGVHVSVRLYQ